MTIARTGHRTAALAAVLALLAGLTTALAPGADAAHDTEHHSHNFVSGTDSRHGTEWRADYGVAAGSNASCAPGSNGDGWNCTPHIPNRIMYGGGAEPGFSTADVEQIAVQIYQSDTSSSPHWWKDSQSNFNCGVSPPDTIHCYSYGGNTYYYNFTNGHDSRWRSYQTLQGGYHYINVYYEYDHWQGYFNVNTTNASHRQIAFFSPINTAFPANQPPVVTLETPTQGSTLSRSNATDTSETFQVRASDPNNHRYTAQIQVARDSSFSASSLIADRTTSVTSNHASASITANLAAEKRNGTFWWRAKACDTAGGSNTACSGWSTASFTYQFSTGPTTTLLWPDARVPVPSGTPLTLTVRANDAELDSYRARITLWALAGSVGPFVFDTAQVPTGSPAAHQMLEALPPRNYAWHAVSTDEHGFPGPQTATGTFTVTP